MKVASLFVILVLFAPFLKGTVVDFRYSKAKELKFERETSYTIEAEVELVKQQFRDRDGFVITDYDPNKDASNASGKRPFTAVRLVKFKNPKVWRGEDLDFEKIRWAYTEIFRLACSGFPYNLLDSGKRFRIYMNLTKSGNRAIQVKVLYAPPED